MSDGNKLSNDDKEWWDARIKECEAEGYKQICPTGGAICVIRYGTQSLLEHEHADHKDYKGMATIEYCGKEQYDASESKEEHAIIYTDGTVAITMYEYCYAMWFLRNGKGSGSLWPRGDWKLTEQSIADILKL